jgi:phosphatidylglycerol lysyltransferase
MALTASVVIIGVFTATVFRSDHQRLLDTLGYDLGALQSGRVWTLPAATLIQAQAGIRWHQALLVLLFLGLLEFEVGSLRTLVTFFLTDWISAPLTVLALWGLGALGWATAEQMARTPDMGSSAASFGAITAAAVLLPKPLREVSLAGVFGFLLIAPTFQQLDIALGHLFAALVGAALGIVWQSSRRNAGGK